MLISLGMLNGKVFSKTTAYVGLVTHGLDLAHIIVDVFLPGGIVILLAIAGPLYLIWLPLVGCGLFRMGR